jgi:integrase
MQVGRATGHVRLVERKRGAKWYLKYRLPDGRQVQACLGPAWPGRGRPPAGYYTRRTAEEALQAILTDARRGDLATRVSTGATFADAAAEWLRHAEHERACKASTLTDYRLLVRRLNEVFGSRALETLTTETIERWRDRWVALDEPANRTVQKYLAVLGSIFRRAKRRYGLPRNPVDDVERPRVRSKAEIDVLSPVEVWALVRAAESEQDAAIFLTAAFTGLRQGELLALHWRDVDFERRVIRVHRTYKSGSGVDTPKSGRGRSVPMAEEVARALAGLGQREDHTGDDDLVFRGPRGHVNAQKLGYRYKAALRRVGLRELRFHDLRHTFGTIAINRADIVQVQAWMGHADIKTTQRYLHYKSRSDEAELLSGAFAAGGAPAGQARATAARLEDMAA